MTLVVDFFPKADSPIHRLDARWKLASIVLAVAGTAVLQTFPATAAALLVAVILLLISRLPARYAFLFAAELTRMRVALRVRGYRSRISRHSYRTVGHVAGTLLVRGYERAERVGQAMRCRGFDGRFWSVTDFHTSGGDVLFFAVLVGATATLVAWDWYFGLA